MSSSIRTIEGTLWNSAKLLTDTISDNLGAEKGLWRVVAGGTQATAYGVTAYLGGKEVFEAGKDTVRSAVEGHPGDAVMFGLYGACLTAGTGVMATLSVAALRSGFKNDNNDALIGKAG